MSLPQNKSKNLFSDTFFRKGSSVSIIVRKDQALQLFSLFCGAALYS